MNIPGSIIDKVTSALNVAISLTMVKAPELHKQMMDAAVALDEAVNASEERNLEEM